jgi:ribosome biogenesis GTPase A
LLEHYPQALTTRYNLPIASASNDTIDGVSVVEAVAMKRGYRLKGGAFDLEKAAVTLLGDYRSGALGRMSLETPASRSERVAAIS